MSVSRELRRIVRDLVVNGLFSSSMVPDRARYRLLRCAGWDLQPCRIAPHVFVGSGSLAVGRQSFINREVLLDPTGGIRIGDRVNIGMRTTLITASHEIGPTSATRTSSSLDSADVAAIAVHDNVWIGANVTILPGVTIEEGCVIAAGAVVTRTCAANGLYAGVPASRIRDLPV